MNDEMRAIEALVRDEKFDQVLEALAAVESTRRLSVAELVLKGECIQIASGDGTPLSEAERAFSAGAI
jgi:nitrogen regulatory protein PII